MCSKYKKDNGAYVKLEHSTFETYNLLLELKEKIGKKKSRSCSLTRTMELKTKNNPKMKYLRYNLK